MPHERRNWLSESPTISSFSRAGCQLENIPLDDLVLFAAKRILDSGEECTVERLVSECFTLFPKGFCLPRYPQWPDSARVNKSWWRCRTDKGWLVGSVKEGLRLTPAGERAVEVVSRKLGLNRPVRQIKKPRERHEALIQKIRSTTYFNGFSATLNCSRCKKESFAVCWKQHSRPLYAC